MCDCEIPSHRTQGVDRERERSRFHARWTIGIGSGEFVDLHGAVQLQWLPVR
jgi:hypothetical protein